MDCKKAKKNIDAYFDNELSSDIKAQIDMHLDSCDECRKVYDAERSVRATMAVLSQTQAPDSLRDSVFEAIDAIEEERHKRKHAAAHIVHPTFNYKPWCFAAACIMLLVVVRAGMWMDANPVVSREDAAAFYEAQENMRMANAVATAEVLPDTDELEAAAEPETVNSVTQTSDNIAFGAEKRTTTAPKSESQKKRTTEETPVAYDLSESVETQTADGENEPMSEADSSGSSGSSMAPQIIVRNVSFVISEKDRTAVTELGIEGMAEEAAEAALAGAGIAFSKQEKSEDRTEEYRVLNVQRVSIEASIAAKHSTDPMTEETQKDIQALTNQLDDVMARQSELNDINNTTIISFEFTQTEAE